MKIKGITPDNLEEMMLDPNLEAALNRWTIREAMKGKNEIVVDDSWFSISDLATMDGIGLEMEGTVGVELNIANQDDDVPAYFNKSPIPTGGTDGEGNPITRPFRFSDFTIRVRNDNAKVAFNMHSTYVNFKQMKADGILGPAINYVTQKKLIDLINNDTTSTGYAQP